MISRLIATRGDVAACWRNVAKLQDQAGKPVDAQHSRDTAKRVSSTNAWIREHG